MQKTLNASFLGQLKNFFFRKKTKELGANKGFSFLKIIISLEFIFPAIMLIKLQL